MNILFSSLLNEGEITVSSFFLIVFMALAVGLFISFVYSRTEECTKSFAVTLCCLPAVVAVVILMVNGNLGAGVAVAGAFSLIRFRSAPGTGKEILVVFLSMAAGLCLGMGYAGIAVIFSVIIMAFFALLSQIQFGGRDGGERMLKITIPENLDFEGAFDDIFAFYMEKAELIDVRTAGMGSVYRLTYKVKFREGTSVKTVIDKIRSRNGNLEIICSREITRETESL